jgi:hypothetical protein
MTGATLDLPGLWATSGGHDAMRATAWERDRVRDYFQAQWPDDPVVHLEKVASERVGSVVYDIWDVHCAGGRWWAVSNPLNAYSQEDFKSRDVVLTFHIGLAVRIASRDAVPITSEAAVLLPGAWRRWEQAVEAMTTATEAEDFQAIGVRLRECLVSFAGEIANEDLVAAGPRQGAGMSVSRASDERRRCGIRWERGRSLRARRAVHMTSARRASV